MLRGCGRVRKRLQKGLKKGVFGHRKIEFREQSYKKKLK